MFKWADKMWRVEKNRGYKAPHPDIHSIYLLPSWFGHLWPTDTLNFESHAKSRSVPSPDGSCENKTVQLISHNLAVQVKHTARDSSDNRAAMAKSKKCVRVVIHILHFEGLHQILVIPITIRARKPIAMVSRSQNLLVAHAL